MSVPRKEKLADLISHPMQLAERWLNDRVAHSTRFEAMVTLFCVGILTAGLSALFLYKNSSTITGVGSISSPTLLEKTTRALGDQTPLETFYDLRTTQAFLDSVDELGVQRMEEIYLEKYKSYDHDRRE